MADTQTTNLNLTKPEPGAAEDTWGISLNADLDTLDAIFSSSGTQVNLNPNQINFADNKKALFGNSSDLQIYHDSLNSYIAETGAGDLNISGGNDLRLRTPDGENGVKVKQNGEVQLYHDGSEKLETTSTGIDVTGTVTATNVSMPDDGVLSLGTSDEFTLKHHNSGYSHLTNTTGTLFIDSESVTFRDDDGSPTNVLINQTGIDVTGTVTSDGVDCNGSVTINNGHSFQVGGDGSGSSVVGKLHNSSGIFTLASLDTRNIKVTTSDVQRLRVSWDGDISFYEDTGTSAAFFWDASAERLGIGTTSPSSALEVNNASAGATVATFEGNYSGSGDVKLASFERVGGAVAAAVTYADASTSMEFGTTTSHSLHLTTGDTTRLTIDNSGNVLIGGTSVGQDDSFAVSQTGKVTIAKASSGSAVMASFKNGGTSVGTIVTSTTATTYNTSSDARLKDVTGEARGLEVINELNPVSYNWKADGKADEGLIAQEVQELVPNAVTGSEDEHYQMDYSKLVVHLVKAVKEQQEQIESLKGEIANLKGE